MGKWKNNDYKHTRKKVRQKQQFISPKIIKDEDVPLITTSQQTIHVDEGAKEAVYDVFDAKSIASIDPIEY